MQATFFRRKGRAKWRPICAGCLTFRAMPTSAKRRSYDQKALRRSGDGAAVRDIAGAPDEGGQRAYPRRLSQGGSRPIRRAKTGKAADEIRLGDVIRQTEPDFALVECFTAGNRCAITSFCRLRGALREALSAFVGSLDVPPWPISSTRGVWNCPTFSRTAAGGSRPI
jgi:hypothetical protein